jgi:hypothetical protein
MVCVSEVRPSEFYAAAAAIIPVLFISLAFESRFKTFMPPEIEQDLGDARGKRIVELVGAYYTLLVTLILVFAEAAALVGLSAGHDLDFSTAHTAWFVLIGLILGGVGIVFPLLVRQAWIIMKGVNGITPLYRIVGAICFTFVFVSCVASGGWALVH